MLRRRPCSPPAWPVPRSAARAWGVWCALCALGTLSTLWTPSLQAQEGPGAREQLWYTVADAELDGLRGGFDLGGGLIVSLGIQQATYINGQLVTQTQIPLTQMDQLSAMQAAALRERLSSLSVVQNGPGNRWGNLQSPADGSAVVHQVAGAGPGTVIQNSLDGQRIQQWTTIDASSNALGLLRAGSWQQTLRDSMGLAGHLR